MILPCASSGHGQDRLILLSNAVFTTHNEVGAVLSAQGAGFFILERRSVEQSIVKGAKWSGEALVNLFPQ